MTAGQGLNWEGRGFQSLPVFAEAPSGVEGEVEGCRPEFAGFLRPVRRNRPKNPTRETTVEPHP